MQPPRARPLRAATLIALLAGALAATSAVHAQMMGNRGSGNPLFKPGPGPDELWEVTTRMEAMGMAMPGGTQQVCIRKGKGSEAYVPKDDGNCRTTNVKTTGNKVTFAMVCTGENPMTGTGEITSTATSYDGRMAMKSTKRGEEMEMVNTFSGKKIGTCTDTSEQYIAKVDADAKAAVAKTCAEGIDMLEPSLFESNGACGAQRKQFCDKAAAVAGEMREPAGHSAARRKYASLQRGFQFCGQDYAQVSRTACDKAVETRNWDFVGSGPCDDQVRAYGPKFCNPGPNRSPDAQYGQLCARYAAITRGTARAGAEAGTASSSSSASAAPKGPDAVQQGVDALRKLLPF